MDEMMMERLRRLLGEPGSELELRYHADPLTRAVVRAALDRRVSREEMLEMLAVEALKVRDAYRAECERLTTSGFAPIVIADWAAIRAGFRGA